MSEKPSATNSPGRGKLPPWLIVGLFLFVIAVSWWQTSLPENRARIPADRSATPTNSASDPSDADVGNSASPIPAEIASEPIRPAESVRSGQDSPSPPRKHSGKSTLPEKSPLAKIGEAHASAQIENQTIRDQEGRVVFQGTIDLQPTLERIRRGGQNSHRNDGTVFQNRERHLPRQPSGYYKEYVHPTPGISGPGPQRVIIGKEGDAWYTPDHYKTFHRIPRSTGH